VKGARLMPLGRSLASHDVTGASASRLAAKAEPDVVRKTDGDVGSGPAAFRAAICSIRVVTLLPASLIAVMRRAGTPAVVGVPRIIPDASMVKAVSPERVKRLAGSKPDIGIAYAVGAPTVSNGGSSSPITGAPKVVSRIRMPVVVETATAGASGVEVMTTL
jgi:hypothetical protein